MGLENPQQQKEPVADYLENDSRFQDLIEEASLDYLKAEDGDWFRKNYSGEVSPEGYLIDRSGKETNFLPSQNVTGDFDKVVRMARNEFGLRFPNEAQEYIEREKTRIYERSEDDPAIKSVEAEITKRTNEDTQVRMAEGKRGLDGYNDVWERVRFRESIHAYDRFISAYPEKAAAYATMNPYIQRAIEGDRERSEETIEKTPIEFRKEVSVVTSQSDTSNEEISTKIPQKETSDQPIAVAQDSYAKEPGKVQNEWTKKFESDGRAIRERVDGRRREQLLHLKETLGQEGFDRLFPKPVKGLSLNEYLKTGKTHRPLEQGEIPDDPYTRLIEDVKVGVQPEVISATSDATISEKKSSMPIKPESVADKKAILEKYLSYQDSTSTPEEKLAMLEWSEKSENAGKYAESLGALFSKVPPEKVEEKASVMVKDVMTVLDKVGVTGSKYAGSKSWAMWDIGKQYHYFTHPNDVVEGYSVADPFTSKEKSQEIVDRHIGWEIFHTKDKSALDKFKLHPLYSEILQYLNKVPKANKELSSRDFALLGQLVRNMTESF